MTTRLSSKGQVVIPQTVREKHGLEPGEDFVVLANERGDVLLRRVRKPTLSLVEHLRRLRGLDFERRKERVGEPRIQ